MGESQIEWVASDDGTPGKTWNPIRGCTRVSEGCRHCYAERVAARFSGPGLPYEGLARRTESGEARWTNVVRTIEDRLLDPLHWTKPQRIFVNSMSDLFHKDVSERDLNTIFAIILLARQHTFIALTKRADLMHAYMTAPGRREAVVKRAKSLLSENLDLKHKVHDLWPLPNLILGVSAENQVAADERIPRLVETPAVLRMVSLEPLLGPVDLSAVPGFNRANLDLSGWWIVVGGESGPGARPMHPAWVRKLQRQCRAARVPFFMKQWGEWIPRSQTTDRKDWHAERTPDGDGWRVPVWWPPFKRATDKSPDPKPPEGLSKILEWGTLAHDGIFHLETTPWNAVVTHGLQDP